MDDKHILFLVGERIKLLRGKKGLSQQDLADLCGFEKSNMSRIESGKSNLTIKTLNIIAIALSVRISELLDIDKKC